MNSSETERFEEGYRRVWGSLMRADEPDLSQHERQMLHHVPAGGGVPLGWLARHLGLPKSTASVLVKDLSRRGLVTKVRDGADERRVSISLTTKGRACVAADTVLDPRLLAAALQRMPKSARRALLDGLERLADAAEAIGDEAAAR